MWLNRYSKYCMTFTDVRVTGIQRSFSLQLARSIKMKNWNKTSSDVFDSIPCNMPLNPNIYFLFNIQRKNRYIWRILMVRSKIFQASILNILITKYNIFRWKFSTKPETSKNYFIKIPSYTCSLIWKSKTIFNYNRKSLDTISRNIILL